MKRKRRKSIRRYLLLTLIGIVLCKMGHKSATAWRGYESLGGEHLFLLLPVLYGLMHETVRDFLEEVRCCMKKGISGSGETLR